MSALNFGCRLVVALAFATATWSAAQDIKLLADSADFIRSPALSPDGKTLAFEWQRPDYSVGIFLRSLSDGQVVYFADRDPKEGSPSTPRWSPDGKQIAFLRVYCHHCDHELFVKTYPSGIERGLGAVCGSAASWTPDGRFLIAAEPTGKNNEECRITLIPTDGNRRTPLTGSGDVAAVSPDGKRLAYTVGNQLKLANLTAEFRIAGTPAHLASEPHGISSINWLPDGKALLYQVWSGSYYSKMISTEGTISEGRVIDPGRNFAISQILKDRTVLGTDFAGQSALWRVDLQAAAHEPRKVRNIPWTDHYVSVSPNGELLAFATNRRGGTQIWVSRIDGSHPRVVVAAIPPFGVNGDQTMIDGISWSPNGRWIALATQPGVGHGVDDARVFLVPADGGPLRVLVDLCSLGRGSPPWSADSQFIFVSKEDEKYEDSYFQVEIASGKQITITGDRMPQPPLFPLPSGAERPHLSQDGRFLYFQRIDQTKSRIVAISNLLPSPGSQR